MNFTVTWLNPENLLSLIVEPRAISLLKSAFLLSRSDFHYFAASNAFSSLRIDVLFQNAFLLSSGNEEWGWNGHELTELMVVPCLMALWCEVGMAVLFDQSADYVMRIPPPCFMFKLYTRTPPPAHAMFEWHGCVITPPCTLCLNYHAVLSPPCTLISHRRVLWYAPTHFTLNDTPVSSLPSAWTDYFRRVLSCNDFPALYMQLSLYLTLSSLSTRS